MKILAISDTEIGLLYSPLVAERFRDIQLLISCGDLPYYYLEYIVCMLDKPLYYVRGNHANQMITSEGTITAPLGGFNLHATGVKDDSGLLLAGIEGCLQYNNGPYQYSQNEMWNKVFHLVPRLLWNKVFYGRYLDVFVSHAPPWKIHDRDDRPHQGIKAFRWLLKVFQPAYHLHGHTHLYRQDEVYQTQFLQTQVMNAYGYRLIEYDIPKKD